MIKRLKIMFIIFSTTVLMSCSSEELPDKVLEKPVSVKTLRVDIQPIKQRLTYSGTVEPIERVRLSTKLMGWIEAIYVDEGEEVQKGATLIKLRSKDIEAKQAQAEAGIAEAAAHHKNVEMNLSRIESLYEKKAATQKELDDIRAAYASAKARKHSAEEMKNEVDEMLKYAELRAPFDGVVTRKMRDAGDLANPGQPILEVENNSKLKIIAKVPENEVQNIEIGMPAQIQVEASSIGINGEYTNSTIDKIVSSADPMSRQFEIHVLLDNPEGKIRSGMFARISIGKADKGTLLVPRLAVFRRGQLEGVYVVGAENRAHLRWIRTGVEQDQQIEILSGLNPGEDVVVEGAASLLDGQIVEVK